MLGIGDVRDLIAGLGIAADDHVYCGKLDDKKDKSIGVYHLNRGDNVQMAVGGIQNSSYAVKSISILIHWNKSVRETEKVSQELYDKLRDMKHVNINDTIILFTEMLVSAPIEADTDDKGIFEMVIELKFCYER
jgi:hypothetical protein